MSPALPQNDFETGPRTFDLATRQIYLWLDESTPRPTIHVVPKEAKVFAAPPLFVWIVDEKQMADEWVIMLREPDGRATEHRIPRDEGDSFFLTVSRGFSTTYSVRVERMHPDRTIREIAVLETEAAVRHVELTGIPGDVDPRG